MKIRLTHVIIGILTLVSSNVFHVAKAGVIDSESVLLDEAGATLLEGWLGKGDLDWDSIWYGTTGATTADWHSSVDGVANTVSIYSVTYLDVVYLVGGYNAKAWDDFSNNIYANGEIDENFLFNLTTNKYFKTESPQEGCEDFQTVHRFDYFANFGCGTDLSGGSYVLGNPDGNYEAFYSSGGGGSYLEDGNILDGLANPSGGAVVISLETFTFSTARPIPEPSILALISLGLLGLFSLNRRKLQK